MNTLVMRQMRLRVSVRLAVCQKYAARHFDLCRLGDMDQAPQRNLAPTDVHRWLLVQTMQCLQHCVPAFDITYIFIQRWRQPIRLDRDKVRRP